MDKTKLGGPTPESVTFEIRWFSGGPGVEVPGSATFENEERLLKHINEVNQKLKEGEYDLDRPDGLAMADAEVRVYNGDAPEVGGKPTEIIGTVDAEVVRAHGEVRNEDLEEGI